MPALPRALRPAGHWQGVGDSAAASGWLQALQDMLARWVKLLFLVSPAHTCSILTVDDTSHQIHSFHRRTDTFLTAGMCLTVPLPYNIPYVTV
jgi:hypothetical protein